MVASQPVCLGVITGAVGIKGEVRIKPFTGRPEDVGAYGEVRTKDGETFLVSQVKVLKKGISARLSGIETRDQAEALKGRELFVERGQLPQTDEEEFYYVDLIGLEAVSLSGEILGKVRAVHDFGAGDVLEVDLATGGSVYVPFTQEVVVEVAMGQGRVVIDPPPGLLGEVQEEDG